MSDQIVEAPPQPARLIHKAICAVMAEVGGVKKLRDNESQRYKFRGIADVYLACQLVMARHGVHVSPHEILSDEVCERTTKSGGQIFHIRQKIRFRAYAEDGSFVVVETTGEAMDTGDKASNKCMSAAMKYCLIQLFALPEQDPNIDTETQSPEVVAAPKKPERPKPSPAQIEALTGLLLQVAPWPDGTPEIERPAYMRAWCDLRLRQPKGTLHSVKGLTPEQATALIKDANETMASRILTNDSP